MTVSPWETQLTGQNSSTGETAGAPNDRLPAHPLTRDCQNPHRYLDRHSVQPHTPTLNQQHDQPHRPRTSPSRINQPSKIRGEAQPGPLASLNGQSVRVAFRSPRSPPSMGRPIYTHFVETTVGDPISDLSASRDPKTIVDAGSSNQEARDLVAPSWGPKRYAACGTTPELSVHRELTTTLT